MHMYVCVCVCRQACTSDDDDDDECLIAKLRWSAFESTSSRAGAMSRSVPASPTVFGVQVQFCTVTVIAHRAQMCASHSGMRSNTPHVLGDMSAASPSTSRSASPATSTVLASNSRARLAPVRRLRDLQRESSVLNVIGAEIDGERMVRVGAVVNEKLTDLFMVGGTCQQYNSVPLSPDRPRLVVARGCGSMSASAHIRSPNRLAYK